MDFAVFTRCPELLQCSVCLLGLGGSSGGGSAVLFWQQRWWAGGRSPSWRGSTLLAQEERSLSLSPGGGEVVEQVRLFTFNTGCLERRSSQAVLRGSRLRLGEAGSTILIVSWSTRRAFSCPHRALKAP